ncbi:MAG: hypothetical protein A2231_10160 [Candidatus Firestonebacteria bacterium RIFOXYA2_FULL_40_8]|nr:MAG: hypothetical protein A2231_10160 [Candidatus Firestonebacteria bacterium RIFOXYA2_FULL_40_8]
MIILKNKISKNELKSEYAGIFETMIKGVADVKNEIIAIDAEMHADLEAYLIEEGSAQEDLWGFNLYIEKKDEEFIEYTSLINIRPHQNNKSMEISDPAIKEKVKQAVHRWIA